MLRCRYCWCDSNITASNRKSQRRYRQYFKKAKNFTTIFLLLKRIEAASTTGQAPACDRTPRTGAVAQVILPIPTGCEWLTGIELDNQEAASRVQPQCVFKRLSQLREVDRQN